MVVEITPIGIDSLHWKFYIIWTVFNFAFVPIVYVFYPETAGRPLEDLDRLFRSNPPLLIYMDKDAISPKRPESYKRHEEDEVRRNSSIDPAVLRRGSLISGSFRDRSIIDDERERNNRNNTTRNGSVFEDHAAEKAKA